MEGLEALAQLRRLALSDNEITTIQGVESLIALEAARHDHICRTQK